MPGTSDSTVQRIPVDSIGSRPGERRPVFTTLPPLSVYVHLPWCLSKCPYCDFNSHAIGDDGIDQSAYVDALILDLEQELPAVWGRPVESVFIGGGTPSLFDPDEIGRLLDAFRARLPLRPGCEITLEANPGTWEKARFRAFREAGVDRLSIGIQSFDTGLLRGIGRVHGRDEALAAAAGASEAGFTSWNIDLMFGLPGQDIGQAIGDIEEAIGFGPGQISHYQLTLEPNTSFHRNPPRLPDDEACWSMQQACLERLGLAGYEHYEVSAHARSGHRCRHNLNYWRFGDYLGIGAGAHGKVTRADTQCIERYAKRRHPNDYLRTAGSAKRVSNRRRTSPDEIVFEFMLNALRLVEGFDPDLFQAHTGLPITSIAPTLEQARTRGLIEDGSPIRPTALGRRHLDELLLSFVPDGDRRPGRSQAEGPASSG